MITNMVKDEYEVAITALHNEFLNKVRQVSMDYLDVVVGCKIGDIVYCTKKNRLYEVTLIDSYWGKYSRPNRTHRTF